MSKTVNSRNMWRQTISKDSAPLDFQLMELLERGSAQGMASFELEKRTNRSRSSVSAGLSRLGSRGFVRYTGYDVVNPTGKTVRRYGIAPLEVE